MPAEAFLHTRPSGLLGVDLLHARYLRHAFSRHSHDGYALGVIEDGALNFRYQRRVHTAEQGAINLVVPGECHDGRAVDAQGWAYRMFYLKPDVVRKSTQDLQRGDLLPDFAAGVLHDPDLARRIRAAHIRFMAPEADTLEKESHLLHLLAIWIHRHAQRGGTLARVGTEHMAVRRARDFLAAHHNANPSLRDTAKAAGMSPFHLLRVFTKTTGQTPHEFLIQKRVDNARELLASALPLARIAAECGFADQSHMTRLFRRQHGVTPGKYRNFILNQDIHRA
jgi:AraC-like DNA-binding protein